VAAAEDGDSRVVKADRLAGTFKDLVAVDSVSRSEGALAEFLRQRFTALGAQAVVDRAGREAGSDTGNLIVSLDGSRDVTALLFNAHLDTVEPGRGVTARFAKGCFASDGKTVLGADDKSGIAILLETLQVIRERGIPHGPLELVLTVCEEIGLLGAKFLDIGSLRAPFGYTLDATDPDGIITQAPSANHLTITVYGKDAHAGSAPQKGVNAIVLAAKAIAAAPDGRIDRETTCNIGRIDGGLATNVVPPSVTVISEVRSHDDQKLAEVTRRIAEAFQETAAAHAAANPEIEPPSVDVKVTRAFSRTRIPDDHPLVLLARNAAMNLGRNLRTKVSGGSADANVFFARGIPMGVLGTGMREVHTTGEHIFLDDMVKTTELLIEIVRLHADGGGWQRAGKEA